MTIRRALSLQICLLGLGLGLALGACGAQPGDSNNWNTPDAAQCAPDGDDDGDGIPNGVEGCLVGRNTDGDEYPDWLDTDSDNDGCLDEMEDLNGDGEVGDCRTNCSNLDPAECGPGQACLATGLCDPPFPPECMADETSPTVADSDGDGVLDCEPPLDICSPVGPDNPEGRPAGLFYTSPAGKLQVVVWDDAVLGEQSMGNAGLEDCANGVDDNGNVLVDCADPECHNTSACGAVSVTFDLEDASRFAPTAGFAFTRRPRSAGGVTYERTLMLEELRQIFDATHVTLRDEGLGRILLDEFPSVVGIEVEIDATALATVSELRNRLVTTLLERAAAELTGLPGPFGPAVDRFVLSMTVQLRSPVVGDPYVVIMGTVTPQTLYDDPTSNAGLHAADVAYGSGLADPGRLTTAHCENGLYLSPRPADILWIVDDSPSALAARTSLAAAVPQLFSRALSLGLDFRMGVTNMNQANNGVLCTQQGQSNDYFLNPVNQAGFQACLLGPAGSLMAAGPGLNNGLSQGYNAIVNHLPRANAPNRIRPDAQLALIYVSTEAAQEVQTACGTSGPDPACVQAEIQPTLNLLQGISNPEGQGTAHAFVGPPPAGCPTATLGSGYLEVATATGGQIASVCQADLSFALQIILEELIATGAGVRLEHWPISVTLGVNSDGVVQQRSRLDGFYFDPKNNTVIINPNVLDPNNPAELVIGYERWLTP